MPKQLVSTPAAAQPGGAYSQAVVANGLAFLAGCTPTTPAGERVSGAFVDQARQAFDNLAAVAAACGAGLQDAVRVGVYLRDMGDFAEMDALYRERFGDVLPARTTIQSDLPGFTIEVDAILLLADRA